MFSYPYKNYSINNIIKTFSKSAAKVSFNVHITAMKTLRLVGKKL